LFFSLQVSILGMLWRVYKLTGESYGVVVWAATLTGALFGNTFESPMGAIPYYMIMGLIIGPILCRKRAVRTTNPRHRPIAEESLATQLVHPSVSLDNSPW
jgi:hypothetical protein